MTKTRTKRAAETVPVPQTAEEASEYLRAIGDAQRSLAAMKAAFDQDVADLKAGVEAEAQPLGATIAQRTRGLEIWAQANRAALAQGKRIVLPTGTLAWRARPPSVRVGNLAEAIAFVVGAGAAMARFLRTKHELDKEAVLKEPEAAAAIPGIRVGSAGEEFVVEPIGAPALAPAISASAAA
jgi:phage host-nuclease inhibitor protein Gam